MIKPLTCLPVIYANVFFLISPCFEVRYRWPSRLCCTPRRWVHESRALHVGGKWTKWNFGFRACGEKLYHAVFLRFFQLNHLFTRSEVFYFFLVVMTKVSTQFFSELYRFLIFNLSAPLRLKLCVFLLFCTPQLHNWLCMTDVSNIYNRIQQQLELPHVHKV